MLKQKTAQALFLTALVFTALCLLSLTAAAQTRAVETRASANFDQTAADAVTTIKEELRVAAKEHRVSINADLMAYASAPSMTVAVAPIAGIERYTDADFAAGVPVQLVIIRTTAKRGLPNGSYVVKAQYRPKATSGSAIFTDLAGTAVTRRNLTIWTLRQAAALFPEIYSDPGIQNIPVVNSVHFLGINSHNVPVTVLDCGGWKPYKVIWYAVLD